MLRTIIIDDEWAGREVLRHMLERFCPEVELLAMAATAEEGRVAIAALEPDLVFLDIEMPLQSGFELLDEYPLRKFDVVFATAHDGYRLESKKYLPADFLLKPYDVSAVKAALGKVSPQHLMKARVIR